MKHDYLTETRLSDQWSIGVCMKHSCACHVRSSICNSVKHCNKYEYQVLKHYYTVNYASTFAYMCASDNLQMVPRATVLHTSRIETTELFTYDSVRLIQCDMTSFTKAKR
jgi:hypothetical protein